MRSHSDAQSEIRQPFYRTWRPSHKRYFDHVDRIWNSIKLCNALVHNIFSRVRHFAPVSKVTLSWHLQHTVVISWVYHKPEHCKFWSNFEFHWNTVTVLRGIYTNAENARGAHADPTRWFCSRSVWMNCVVLFTSPWARCASAAGARRDSSWSDSSAGPAGIGSPDWSVFINQRPSAAKRGFRQLKLRGPALV